MLSPERLDEAGDLVAGVYAEMETVMLLSLVRTLLSGEAISSGRTMTELLLLAQSKRAELQAIVDRYADRIDAATLATVREFLRESDEADVAVIGGKPTWPRQVAATVQGIAEVLDRDNLDMIEGAIQSFIGESARACTLVNTGVQTTERALHHAVRALMRAGVPIVTYRDPGTGRQTVRNHVDVAVRRHIRTQISQDAGRVTLATMEHAGARFVEVTSHTGARPSHQVWQGRVYALDGPVTVDGVTYPDFGEGTGYYGTGPHAALGDRLCGINCRHHFGVWVPGTPHRFERDPKHPSGLDNDEVYQLTQDQRALERLIRADKRELAGMVEVWRSTRTPEALADVREAQRRLRADQQRIRDLIADANSRGAADVLHRQRYREWAGDMPEMP